MLKSDHGTIWTNRHSTIFTIILQFDFVLFTLLILLFPLCQLFNCLTCKCSYFGQLSSQLGTIHQLLRSEGVTTTRTFLFSRFEPIPYALLTGKFRAVGTHMSIHRFTGADHTGKYVKSLLVSPSLLMVHDIFVDSLCKMLVYLFVHQKLIGGSASINMDRWETGVRRGKISFIHWTHRAWVIIRRLSLLPLITRKSCTQVREIIHTSWLRRREINVIKCMLLKFCLQLAIFKIIIISRRESQLLESSTLKSSCRIWEFAIESCN